MLRPSAVTPTPSLGVLRGCQPWASLAGDLSVPAVLRLSTPHPADSQGPQQLGGQQELHPLDDHNHDGAGTHSPDIPAQPPSEWRATAPQMHPSPSSILSQARSSEATRVVDSRAIFPGVDAAGGRKAAGLDPRGAAVKVPVRVHLGIGPEGRARCSGPGAESGVSYRPFKRPRPTDTHAHAHTHLCTHSNSFL